MTKAWESGKDYLHTALDDLESFLWVLTWALLQITKQRTRDEQSFFNTLDSASLLVLRGKRELPKDIGESDSISPPLFLFRDLLTRWGSIAQDAETSKRKVKGQPPKDICINPFQLYVSAGIEHRGKLQGKSWEDGAAI